MSTQGSLNVIQKEDIVNKKTSNFSLSDRYINEDFLNEKKSLSTVYPGMQFTNIATHSNGETRNSMAFLGLNISAGIVLSALGNLITM